MTEEDLLKPESFRDTASTVTLDGDRKWIHALQPKGFLYKIRNLLSSFYLIAFFAIPFIKINGNPLLLFNFPKGEFIILGKIFWPQDFFIFAIGMLAMIVFVVLFTVIFGRLFCGWACPQTIFMEIIFRRIEWWIEGSPAQQLKLKHAPWTVQKIFKKTLKHVIFFVVSLIIAHTFLSYIVGIEEVMKYIQSPIFDHINLFMGVIAFTLLFYSVYAFVREIVCTTICPYGRLQGVMFDKDTILVAYDYNRGEPRGHIKKDEIEVKGDCIDCKKCVQVCPTGIDIRNGVQLDCVGCTACIDACDEVMDKIGRPQKLIRYASENELEKGKKFQFTRKVKAYIAVLVLLLGLMLSLILTRKNIEMYVSRAPGQLFQEVDGKIVNMYEAKIYNKSRENRNAEIQLHDLKGEIELIGAQDIMLKKENINQLVFLVKLAPEDVPKRSIDLDIDIKVDGEVIQTVNTNFLGPFK